MANVKESRADKLWKGSWEIEESFARSGPGALVSGVGMS